MNGPRTNQFVAPTSFITSISLRRAKIERRIVFATSKVDEMSSTKKAISTTILMATHDREMVDKMRKRVIALESGKLLRDERRGGYTTE